MGEGGRVTYVISQNTPTFGRAFRERLRAEAEAWAARARDCQLKTSRSSLSLNVIALRAV